MYAFYMKRQWKLWECLCHIHTFQVNYIKLFFVTQMGLEYDEDRALHTLPPGLVVKPSSIIGAGLGVFTEREIPPRVMFGPYGGVEIHDEMTAHDSGYCWQVKLSHRVHD
jgi:hypothetical protein